MKIIVNTSDVFKERTGIRDITSYAVWLHIFLRRGKSAFFSRPVTVTTRRVLLEDKLSVSSCPAAPRFPGSLQRAWCQRLLSSKWADAYFLYSQYYLIIVSTSPPPLVTSFPRALNTFCLLNTLLLTSKLWRGWQGSLEGIFIFWAQKILSHRGQVTCKISAHRKHIWTFSLCRKREENNKTTSVVVTQRSRRACSPRR